MSLDPAQRYRFEQDAVPAEWEDDRLATSKCAIVLLREIADSKRYDDCDVIIGTDTVGGLLPAPGPRP